MLNVGINYMFSSEIVFVLFGGKMKYTIPSYHLDIN